MEPVLTFLLSPLILLPSISLIHLSVVSPLLSTDYFLTHSSSRLGSKVWQKGPKKKGRKNEVRLWPISYAKKYIMGYVENLRVEFEKTDEIFVVETSQYLFFSRSDS